MDGTIFNLPVRKIGSTAQEIYNSKIDRQNLLSFVCQIPMCNFFSHIRTFPVVDTFLNRG